jgi:hypothetical protein
MNVLRFILRKTLVVAAGIGLIWILCASSASVAAASQDRYTGPSGELIPPLRLSEQDFKQGFHKTFQIPNFAKGEWEPEDSRSGTLSLSYTPGYLAPIRAVLNVTEKHVCGEDQGREKYLTFSINWSGELDPCDEDPEGKFPAQSYNFVGDVPGFKCGGCDCKRLPNPMMAFDLWLMREGPDGKLYRVTCVTISTSQDCLCYDPPHEPFGRHLDLGFGPELSEAIEEEKSLTLEGCADLLKGGKGQLTAKAKSEGGKYKWSTDSGSVLSVSESGSSASVSGKSTGRTVVRVEYETEDGEKIEAEKSGSVVELRSVAPVPAIPLIDENGNELSPIEVSVVQDPPDGDLLTFVVADPGVATVLNLGSVLQIQGIREGSTTAQAQTACGEKTGPVIKLDVVRCDEKAVQKLREELRMIKARLDSGQKYMAEITSDEEFDRAAREGPDDIKDVAKSTAELISSTMGAAGKVSKAAKTADNLWGMFNTFNTLATGVADGDMGKVAQATDDALIQVLDLTVLGLAKTAYAAGSASRKLARDLGTLCGAADRIKELQEQTEKTNRELDEVERRLYKVCGEKSSPKKEPSPPSKPAPSAKPSPAPKPAPTPKPTTPKTEPTQPQTQEPAEPKTEKPQTGSGGEKPPVSPPTKPAGGAVGLPLNCGCDSWRYNSWGSSGKGLIRLADDLRGAGQCSESFESSILPGFQNDLDLLSSALKDISGARSLPKQEVQAKFKSFLTKTNGLSARLENFTEQAALYHSYLEGCVQTSKQAADLIRKGAAETGAEMTRK